jgi:hypothetical protein
MADSTQQKVGEAPVLNGFDLQAERLSTVQLSTPTLAKRCYRLS